VAELVATFPALPPRATLLDVGTGLGDIPLLARSAAARAGIALDTIGLEATEWLATGSRPRTSIAIVGDGRALPFADQSIDVVTCSQVLHHFFDRDAARLVQELHRVARVRVIISEIRRSQLAVAGIWVASFALGFHPVSRHDGVVSVRRGFTVGELAETVHDATGASPAVRRRPGFRVTASWAP
jgi:SAM-dependent methyltransferase